MNPENKGEQIGLHHSYLWRKSMFVNNDGEVKPSCHRQLNDCKLFTMKWPPLDKVGEPGITLYTPI